jgi:ubiquinone/menaquinone biosynthesis C-methylase UbiE
MDNSIYGYDLKKLDTIADKSYEYLKAVKELIRVLKSGGTLLITFPFGKFENHGFFQQFDDEMLTRTEVLLQPFGTIETDFIQYINQGWQFAQRNEMHDVRSYNPHTGVGKTDDGAAHCRGICLIQFIKK